MSNPIYITPHGKIELPERAAEFCTQLAQEADRLAAFHGYTGGEITAGAVIYAALTNKLNANPGHERDAYQLAIDVFTIVSFGRREPVH